MATLAEIKYNNRMIADMLGQDRLTIAQYYFRRANRSRKLLSPVENQMPKWIDRKQKLSNMLKNLSNPIY